MQKTHFTLYSISIQQIVCLFLFTFFRSFILRVRHRPWIETKVDWLSLNELRTTISIIYISIWFLVCNRNEYTNNYWFCVFGILVCFSVSENKKKWYCSYYFDRWAHNKRLNNRFGFLAMTEKRSNKRNINCCANRTIFNFFNLIQIYSNFTEYLCKCSMFVCGVVCAVCA